MKSAIFLGGGGYGGGVRKTGGGASSKGWGCPKKSIREKKLLLWRRGECGVNNGERAFGLKKGECSGFYGLGGGIQSVYSLFESNVKLSKEKSAVIKGENLGIY